MTTQKPGVDSLDPGILERCTRCGTCEDVCSIFVTTGKDAPHEKIAVTREILAAAEKPAAWETVFHCTKCEACDAVCPEQIPVSKVVDLGRRTAVEKFGVQYSKQAAVTANIEHAGNPFGETGNRTAWLSEPVPAASATLLHLGCMFSYRLQGVARSIVAVLKQLGVEFTLSPEERCCGYFVYNAGLHDAAARVVEQTRAGFLPYERVITACAGCYTFIQDQYGLAERGVQVEHLVEVVDRELAARDWHWEPPPGTVAEPRVVIYADACHLTRPHGIVEPPRRILARMGYELREFPRHHAENLCCGADGGMRIIDKPLALEIGRERVRTASARAGTLFTSCPFCYFNFAEAARETGSPLVIRNLFEDLADKLGWSRNAPAGS